MASWGYAWAGLTVIANYMYITACSNKKDDLTVCVNDRSNFQIPPAASWNKFKQCDMGRFISKIYMKIFYLVVFITDQERMTIYWRTSWLIHFTRMLIRWSDTYLSIPDGSFSVNSFYHWHELDIRSNLHTIKHSLYFTAACHGIDLIDWLACNIPCV